MSDPAPTGPSGTVPTCYRHPGREAYIRCQRCEKIICPDCMRDSAVGFQCPDCVKEGARTTRSARTAYGGLRPTNAGITSMVIIGVNVLVWLAILVSQAAGRLLRLAGPAADLAVPLGVADRGVLPGRVRGAVPDRDPSAR